MRTLILTAAFSSCELQAAQQDDLAGTEEASAAGWLDSDTGAESLPVPDAASRLIWDGDQIEIKGVFIFFTKHHQAFVYM